MRTDPPRAAAPSGRRQPVARLVPLALLLLAAGEARAQQRAAIEGRVVNAAGAPLPGAVVQLDGRGAVATGEDGTFRLGALDAGPHRLRVQRAGLAPLDTTLVVAAGATLRPTLCLCRDAGPVALGEVEVRGRALPGAVAPAPEVLGTLVAAGARSEVLQVDGMDANLTEKTGRQLLARVPGAFVYDMDGSGNQLNVSTRGLDPHRSWELNVRQDGVLVNSDLYGYPASHYSPPLESLERLELVRGTAALQYGSQFGGQLNYVTKTPDTTRAATFESVNSAGSFGLLSTYDAVGGRVGPVTYYGYVSARRSDGYRASSRADYAAQFLRATVQVAPTLSLRAQVGRSTYRTQIPGALTDDLFAADPRQSTRSRNYYSPDITVPSLTATWTPRPATRLVAQLSGVFGRRESVQFVGFATAPDLPDPVTGEYAPRQVDVDRFHSLAGELRLLHDWQGWGRAHTLAAGVALADNDMRRQQLGRGTNGTGWDLTLAEGDFARDVFYRTDNVAAYVEQLLRVTPRWSVIPGARVELGTTRLRGRLDYLDPADVPTDVRHRFPLFGVRTEYHARGDVALYGGWSQAYRPMILSDMLPASAIERTDPDLRDARGWTAEAGARGTLAGVAFDAGLFEMRYDDRFGALVRTDPASGESYVFRTNVGSTRTRGVELRLDAPLWAGERVALGAFTAGSWFDAAYRAGSVMDGGVERPLRGNQVEGVPDWIARGGVTATGGRWSLTALASHVAESFADPLNTVAPTPNGARGVVPAYTVLDLNGGVDVARWLRVGAGVSNLLDAQYFTKRPTMYPGPGIWPSDGRGVRLTVELRP